MFHMKMIKKQKYSKFIVDEHVELLHNVHVLIRKGDYLWENIRINTQK